MFSRRLRFPKL
jgi:hypothetical protein